LLRSAFSCPYVSYTSSYDASDAPLASASGASKRIVCGVTIPTDPGAVIGFQQQKTRQAPACRVP